jgi:CRP-like cAMP-binding protein
MSRYESSSERRTRSEIAPTQIHKAFSPTGQATGLPELLPGEGLSNAILASLPAPELKRLLPFLDPVSLVAGDEIVRSIDSDYVYFPESAVISHLYVSRDGTATAAAVIGNDGLVGLSAILYAGSPVYSARIMIGGAGLRVKSQVIRQEFARGQSLQRLVLAYVSKRMEQVSQRAVCNGRHRLAERLCTWLLMIDDRVEARAIPLTHADLANHLGARRAVISGCCYALRTSNIIDYKRGHMMILDRKMLESRACECYDVLKPLID